MQVRNLRLFAIETLRKMSKMLFRGFSYRTSRTKKRREKRRTGKNGGRRIMARIAKTSTSITQKLSFTTIKDLEDYLIVTCPIGWSIEVKDKTLHLRKSSKDTE